MNLHANAALSWTGRRRLCELVVDQGWTVAAAAASARVSVRCARKWVGRYRLEGVAGLRDRSSAPRCVANRTAPDRVEAIIKLRRLRFTAAEIAETLGMGLSTVSGILTRVGLGKLGRIGLEPPVRYERSRPGELVHIDVKKLGRFTRPGHRMLGRGKGRFEEGAGYEYVHVCVDDFSRLAYVELLADERALTAIGFLRRALAWFAAQGVQVERVMTDNGPAYCSHAHQAACTLLGLRHSRTKPRRPRTNGKAERFIQTLLAGWAYGRLYASSCERAQALPLWLKHYNYTRPHGSLGHQPPASRLNNVSRNYI
jgi:transposase InsO family protein